MIPTLTPQELQQLQVGGGEAPLVLDVREPSEWSRCRLPGALTIPMGQIPAALDSLRPHAGRSLVVFCHHGIRSAQVVRYLLAQGFEAVFNLQGGIDAWSRLVDPSVPRY